MDLKQAFGLALREQRKKTGISQEALAESAELDRTYISLLERGSKSPTLDTINKLASSLKVEVSALVIRAEQMVRGGNAD